jgi:hypothetical protein
MIGKVAKIQGAPKSPKYPTMFLQGMLSTRHVGWSRVKLLGGVTINEFMQKLSSNPVNDAYEESKNALIQLGLIEEKSVPLGDNRTVKAYVPNRPNDVEWQGNDNINTNNTTTLTLNPIRIDDSMGAT